MKILVTGAAGFIGFHVTRRLLQDGVEVVGIDNLNNYYSVDLKYGRLEASGIPRNKIKTADGNAVQSELNDSYTFYKIDLTDRISIESLFEEHSFDTVIHLAAQAGVRYSIENPHSYVESNVDGFLNILEGCRHHKVDHLIYASSSSVYGANTDMPFRTSDRIDRPISLYAATKKSNELMAYTYSHLYGIPTTGLRFFTVYGPWGRPDMAIFLFVKAIFEGRPIDVFNRGEMERDFTYIDDIVEGVVRLIARVPESGGKLIHSNEPALVNNSSENSREGNFEPPTQLFNIGFGRPVPLMDFIREIEDYTGEEVKKNLMPMQPGDVQKTWADVDDLYDKIDFRPKVTVKEGVRRFIDWYREYYNV